MIVTITCKEGRKIVDQFDVDLPSEAGWIAQDEDGQLCWFINKPVYSLYGSPWWSSQPVGNRRSLLNYEYVDNYNPNANDSLIKVSDIK